MMKRNFRISSYNIRKARGLDNRRKPERTLEVINRLNADIVVLQEADMRLGARAPAIGRGMIARETDFELVEVSKNGTSLGWHGNAVLVRRGINVDSIEHIDLPGMEPRGAVHFKIGGNFELSVVATHLGLLRRHRVAQLKAICDATSGDKNTIIAGDMNEWSATKGFAPLADRFMVHSPGRSFHARRPIAGLDRFAISGGIQFLDAGVAQDALARRASDHLPIWCDISV